MLNETFSVIFKHCDPGEPWPFRSLFGRWSLSPGRSFQEGSVFALVLVGRQCNFCCVHFDLSHFDFHRYEHHCGSLFYFVDCMGNVGSLWIHSRNQRRKTGWNGFLCESSKRFLNRKYVTLFEIFIFCPKIQLWFPEKIVDFLGGENLVKMLWFWTF